MTFLELRLAEPILRALVVQGYTTPTPIQVQAIPHVLAGRDLLGSAQTGTGKTAAFALPILQRLERPRTDGIRALVLVPTRELASQIAESFHNYGRNLGLRQAVVFGGVGQGAQERALRGGVDILVATPGRLLDLMNQGIARLGSVQTLVLDEADRMLDMGFIHDIRRIIGKLPARKQTLLFSATMPTEIRRLAESLLHNPVAVQVAAPSAPADHIEHLVYHVERTEKPALLRKLLMEVATGRTLVFTRTKRGADRVVKQLRAGGVRAEAIHGNKNQNARQRALASFKSQQPPVLVATDIASRGIDVDDIDHVVNYEMPIDAETYVHRIGRTGRAGATGTAVSFCDSEERPRLKAVERLIRQPLTVRGAPARQVANESASIRREMASLHVQRATRPAATGTVAHATATSLPGMSHTAGRGPRPKHRHPLASRRRRW